MVKIAIVEDEKEQSELLRSFAEKYCNEKNEECQITQYPNGLDFVSDYTGGYDVVFMDINMPHLDGISAAEQLRKVDDTVLIVFVTNMAQFAIKGYKVNALDFILKPVVYFDFSLEMDKIMKHVRRRVSEGISLTVGGMVKVVQLDDIHYIELINHNVVVCTKKEKITFRGTLKDIESKLDNRCFSRCSNCYIVNMFYVKEITGDMVTMSSGDKIFISRGRKKQFIDALKTYITSSGGKEIR